MKRLTYIAGALATLVAATPTIQDAHAANHKVRSSVSNKILISPAAKQILMNRFATPQGTVVAPFAEGGPPTWVEWKSQNKTNKFENSINPAANVYKSFNRR